MQKYRGPTYEDHYDKTVKQCPKVWKRAGTPLIILLRHKLFVVKS